MFGIVVLSCGKMWLCFGIARLLENFGSNVLYLEGSWVAEFERCIAVLILKGRTGLDSEG